MRKIKERRKKKQNKKKTPGEVKEAEGKENNMW